MYNNPYYNQQPNIDRINAQITELERMKTQLQQPQPTNLTQNFQLAPTNNEIIRYATSLDEVQKNIAIGDTPYFSRDMSIVWIKNAKGEIKTYELTEIIAKDEKDMQIEMLKAKVNELERKIVDEPSYEYDDESVEDEKSTNFSTIRRNKKK